MRTRAWSLRTRWMLATGALSIGILLLTQIFSNHWLRRHLDREIWLLMNERVRVTTQLLTHYPQSIEQLRQRIQEDDDPALASGVKVRVLMKNNNHDKYSIIAETHPSLQNIPNLLSYIEKASITPIGSQHFFSSRDVQHAGEWGLARISLLIPINSNSKTSYQTFQIDLAIDRARDETLLRAFQTTSTGIVLLFLMISLLAGRSIATQILSPLSTLLIKVKERPGIISLHDLPAELVPLARSLNRLQKKLNRSYERLSQFSDNLAHELRSPLHALQIQLEDYERQTGTTNSSPNMQRVLRLIESMSELISGLLTLARSEDPAASVPMAEFKILPWIDDLIDLWTPLAEEHHVQLSLEVSPSREAFGDDEIRANASLLGQALGNLISNAIDHSPQTNSASFAQIRVLLAKSTNSQGATYVDFFVDDMGPGVAPSRRTQLTDRFFRKAHAPSISPLQRYRVGQGLGLGLPLAHAITRLHQGTLTLQTAPQPFGGLRGHIHLRLS